jgi:hypothetical protein
MVPEQLVTRARPRALTPIGPAAAQNPDVLPGAQAGNTYRGVPAIVTGAMDGCRADGGARIFEYCGHYEPSASSPMAAAGAVQEAIDAGRAGERVGLPKVRLPAVRRGAFIAALPATARRIAVLDAPRARRGRCSVTSCPYQRGRLRR